MITLRKRILFALFPVVLLLATGCTRHSKKERYYLVATNINLGYWKTAASGFQKAAAEFGVTGEIRGPTTFDPQGEVDAFRAVAAMKPAGILVSVSNSKLMAPAIDDAIAAGIPVITMDSDAPESKRLYFIGTNNQEAGRLGGHRVAAQLNGKGNVVFFSNEGQPNQAERLKGYQEVFELPWNHGGKNFYFAGDTEGTPEMRALRNIDVAFIPMNLPYTMTPDEAADAVKQFKPKIAIPYHYRGQDIQKFADDLKGTGIEVRLLDWYSNSATQEERPRFVPMRRQQGTVNGL